MSSPTSFIIYFSAKGMALNKYSRPVVLSPYSGRKADSHIMTDGQRGVVIQFLIVDISVQEAESYITIAINKNIFQKFIKEGPNSFYGFGSLYQNSF